MKISYYIITSILLLQTIYSVYGQSEVNDIKTVELKIKSSKEFLQKNADSALFIINQAQVLAKQLDNDTLLIKSRLQKSHILIFKQEFIKADSLLTLNLSKESPRHLEGLTLYNKGIIQYYKQDFNKALELYLQAVEKIEESNKSEYLLPIYTNIAVIHSILKNYENAQTYFEKALFLSEENESTRLQILVNLSNIYLEQKLYDKFIDIIFEAEKLAQKFNQKRTLSVIYNNLSNYYSNGKSIDQHIDYDLSIRYGKKSAVLKKELNILNSLNVTYNNIGHSYLKKNQYNLSIKYLDSALPNSKGVLKSYIYNNLKESYEGLGEYKTAIEYADLNEHLKDSINDASQREKVTELTEQYESEKKQQEIHILDTKNELQALTISQQKYVLILLVIFVLLFIVLGYIAFKNYKTKQQLDTILLKQKFRKTQLNPHFLFNALQSIQTFIHKNEKEKSSTYLTSYSKLIRVILENSDENFISVENDKLSLESYLKLQQLTHNNSFTYSVNVASTIDEDFDMLPTLITQPFVENAILHGLKGISKGVITIKYYKKETVLYVSIVDNGTGFIETIEDSRSLHKSMSMEIIKEQLKSLNKSSKDFQSDIQIESSITGTKVVLSFTAA